MLAALLDIVRGSAVVNGQRYGAVALRDKCTRLRIEDMAAATCASVPRSKSEGTGPGTGQLHATPSTTSAALPPPQTAAAPELGAEVASYIKSVIPYRLNGKDMPQLHASLAPAVLRDVTLGWLEATRRGVASPDSAGLPPSAAFQPAVDALLYAPAGAAGDDAVLVASRATAFEALLALADAEGGEGGGSSIRGGVAAA